MERKGPEINVRNGSLDRYRLFSKLHGHQGHLVNRRFFGIHEPDHWQDVWYVVGFLTRKIDGAAHDYQFRNPADNYQSGVCCMEGFMSRPPTPDEQAWLTMLYPGHRLIWKAKVGPDDLARWPEHLPIRDELPPFLPYTMGHVLNEDRVYDPSVDHIAKWHKHPA